jgi:3-hydroxyacyl-[acyl-carrier-protein] dehydratase
MNQENIKQIIPHRDKMLLVEEAEVKDGVAFGKYHVRGDEFFLQGHFPDNPIVPGVILCEMLAQSCCVLLAENMRGKDITPMFTGLDKVRFKNSVKPGDTFETECELTGNKGPFYFAKGKGYVANKLCLSAEFSFAIVDNKANNQ